MKFQRPRVLITTRIEEALAFYRRCNGRVSYVPLTQQIHYPLQAEADVAKLDRLTGTLPLQLIEQAEGIPIEAFVIGEDVLFTAAGKPAAAMPCAVAAACRDIARALGLVFCRVSLIMGEAGATWCLGLDRSPQLYMLTEETADEIAEHLTALLVSRVRSEQT